MSWRLTAHTFFIVVLLAGSFINNDFFGLPVQYAFFAFVLATAAFILFAALSNFSLNARAAYHKTESSSNSFNLLPALAWLALTGYYLALAAGRSNLHIGPVHYYWLCLGLLLIQLALEFVIQPVFFRIICAVIVFGGIMESCLCLLQFIDAVPSMSPLFRVTGSWVNPNVTGMYLAMSVPAALLLAGKGKLIVRCIAIFSLVIAGPAIYMLGTRSALAGIAAALFVTAAFSFRWMQRIKKGPHRSRLFAVLFALVILIPLTGYTVYHLKPASSAGRVLIWKISLHMLGDRPFSGSGLGMFDHDYNLRQAAYFKANTPSGKEIDEASYVQVAYNEYLSSAVEGGLPGFLLFVCFVLSSIAPLFFLFQGNRPQSDSDSESREQTIALAGISCWATMSLVNFTINAVPVMIVFLVYVARSTIFPTHIKSGAFTWRLPISSRFHKPMYSIVVPVLAAILLFVETQQALAFRKTAKGELLALQGDLQAAVSLEAGLEDIMSSSRWYWSVYGNMLYRMHRYEDACDKYIKAVSLSSNPDYYYSLGSCYFQLNKLNEAEAAWITARDIQPNRFVPRLALMRLYAYRKDTAQALSCAHVIVDLQPKIPSLRTDSCKNEAHRLISQLQAK